MQTKIFGIGFHKTGTTSLAEALRVLGYRVTGPNWTRESDLASTVEARALELAKQYDAFQDNPWPILYRQLDEAFPGSLFILTTRPLDLWLSSCIAHFGAKSTPMREWIYGVGAPLGNEQVFLKRHQRHLDEVREYFSGEPQRLLQLAIAEGEGWDKLCSFLGHDVPAVPFPHSNRAEERTTIATHT